MGNPQHLDWLLEGVTAWNARRLVEYFQPDFFGTNFFQAFQHAEKLTNSGRISLGGANLRDADLVGANLSYANLGNANLTDANLEGANLSQAYLTHCKLSGAYLREADLSGANLSHANLKGSILTSANLELSDLSRANLREAKLNSAILNRAFFRDAECFLLDVTTIFSTKDNMESATDLRNARGLEQVQIDNMIGDASTKLPLGISAPAKWATKSLIKAAVTENQADTVEQRLTLTFNKITPAFEVRWVDGILDAEVLLDAIDPLPKQFHPPVAPSAQMDLLASLAQVAGQISASLTANTTENTGRITGNASSIFNAIQGEVEKKDGPVLSFVIDFNLTMVAALATDEDFGALSDVDQSYITQFLVLGQQWRQANGIIQEITNPLDVSILPEENLETLELKIEDMIGFLTEDGNARYFTPRLPGVTAAMSIYPWDKEDPEQSRRKRVVAFGGLAAELYKALSHPPVALGLALTGFLGSLASILALFN